MQTHQAPPSPRQDAASSFMIPSIHDGVELECRIRHPHRIKSSRGAIIAHPYGPLGGSFDDVVVQTTVSTFVSEGYIVGTFNFRGVGASKGRTSWTGKAEAADYATFVAFFLLYLCHFQEGIESARSSATNCEESDERPSIEGCNASQVLVLGGYSYGSLLTIELPPIAELLYQIRDAREGSAESNLEQQAQHQAETHRTSSATQMIKMADIRSSLPQVSYLLVSPLLPPLSWAIALPLPKFGFRSHHGSGSDAAMSGVTEQVSKKLSKYPTLAVYSDNDQFTGIKKLRRWSADLQNQEHSQFRCFEVAGAGHFWQSESQLEALQGRLREWLRSSRKPSSS